ncbi:ATP synthase subunit I [Heliophilum fasciatum]|uniref:ATP synthase I subunit n=1 Tax=Heliophilum fasciatum TaxID=35700 RepID=A0A4R2RQ60_9FIRM|nr:ATP synthase subunit I [Heliophilum fasciatum]MCW2277481.1 F0F1-type ATP synthase assembly protein I [Heliophilum fasciatum]TCP65228.1 ATP synthase I subunit [Heliophilum fasciatum]
MELSRLLARLWRQALLGVGTCLALVPFVDTPAWPAGFALGLTSGLLASWLLILRLRRMEEQPAAQAVRSIQLSSLSRFALGALALLIAFQNPRLFDLLATGIGLISYHLYSIFLGWVETQRADTEITQRKE